jgi:hypothetical protein
MGGREKESSVFGQVNKIRIVLNMMPTALWE